MTNKDCIFCKIVKGELPCVKIYEDKNSVAFLDINPATKGHTLVIPKKHYENIFDIPEKVLEGEIKVVQKIAKMLKEKLNADGINLLNSNNSIAQQDVFHYHMHIIPRYSKDNFKINFENEIKEINLEKVKQEIVGK